MILRKLIAVAAMASCMISTPAFADSSSATMSVSAVVRNNCNVAASPMSFSGESVSTTSSVDATAQISVNCTSQAAFTVAMDRGTNAAGEQRRMVNENGEYLDYAIFADASRTEEWGGDTNVVSNEGTGASLTAYGRINAITKDTQSGTYRDTITVSVNF